MDSQQYLNTNYFSASDYRDYSFPIHSTAYMNPEGSFSGTSHPSDGTRPSTVKYGQPSFPSELATVHSGTDYVEQVYRPISIVDSTNGDTVDISQQDGLRYPLDKIYSYYSTIAGSKSNNYDVATSLQTNLWRYPWSNGMDASQKESWIWRLERDNQSMRKELAEYRREIDRLRSLLSQGESNRIQNNDTSRSQSRYWTPEEHQRFLVAIQKYGHKDVKAIANYVGTRNRTQVRTHAQKYFQRISREFRNSKTFRVGKRCMSEPNLYGMELQSCSSRCGVSLDEESGEDSGSNAQDDDKMDMNSSGKPPPAPPSGIDLLSAVASTWKLPHN
ncbi:Myb-like protein I [Galdieria sulphuraria]|nr:Myb-like protein I [Galdieria sulphuraria]